MWFSASPKKESEQNPTNDKAVLESLLAAISDAVIFYDADFIIKLFNKGAEDLLKISADKIIGQKIDLETARSHPSKILVYVMYPSLAPTIVRQTGEGNYPQIIDLSLEDLGKELTIIFNRVFDSNGRLAGYVKVVRDRTREKELARLQKDFITVAAHRLRAPVTGINWTFENLMKNSALDKELLEEIRPAQSASKNLLKIVNDLLVAAEFTEGRVQYQKQGIDLTEFLDKLLTEAELAAREYQVKIYFNRPTEKIVVSADIIKLSQAVSNLIDNAIKYNVKNGEVALSVEKVSEEGKTLAKIIIKDTGLGIMEKDQSRVFEKFFRGGNIAQESISGSGLGLAISKDIIEAHGGKIWLESVVNRGTTVFFTLLMVK